MNSLPKFRILSQPEVTAPDAVLAEAVITWAMIDGNPKVISRYRDNVWQWPAVGTLANYKPRSRSIVFEKVLPNWQQLLKQALFASLRHPRAGTRPPGFHNLRHKFAHLRRLAEFATELGLSHFCDLTKSQVEAFLRDITTTADHIETVVGHIATLSETHKMMQQGLLTDGLAFNVSGLRSSLKMAKTLWKEVKGCDFNYENEGYQPFVDEDIEQIMGVALHYIRRLSKPLIIAHQEVTRIWQANGISLGKRGGNAARRVLRDVPAMLGTLPWEENVTSTRNWPPTTGRQVNVQLRLLQGLCLITIAFFTLARRSELLSLKAHECLSQNEEGEWILRGRIFKGEDDLQGRPASWPIPAIAADAVQVLRDIRTSISLRSVSQTGQPIGHDSLLTLVNYSDGEEESENSVGSIRQVQPLSHSAVNGLVRDLKLSLFPEIQGGAALHRFRKTSARLVALTVEGSSLVLKNILHHDNPRTTLHYMFASPLMQQELATVWPEISASNLRELYGQRNTLVGAGAVNLASVTRSSNLVASAQTESDLDVKEDEFVSLGVEMMEKGHMLLTRLGVGIWCLKPALERGNCAENSRDIIPNGGRCSVQCRFHIQDGRRTATNLRDLADLDAKLASPELARPLRALYQRYRADLLTLIPPEIIPA